jgi:hypothetical protein
MTITLDGYKVSRTQRLEDLTTGLGTSLSALAEQVWEENPMSSTFRQTKLEEELFGGFVPGTKGAQFKGPPSPVLGKIDADKKVSDAGVKLDIGERGIPEGALDLMIERKREEVKRKALIDAAPEGFWSGAAQIGTALAVSIADPINVASAFVPVIGQARYAKLVANTSTALGRSAVRAGVGVTEGLVGAALVEPVILLAAEAEQAEYGLYDSFLNLTFGAVLGGGLHTGLGAIGDAIGRGSPQLKEDMLRAANGQVMDNRPIDVGYVAQTDISFIKAWDGIQVDEIRAKAASEELKSIREELLPVAGNKLKRGELKKLTSEIKDLEFKAKKLEQERREISEQEGFKLKQKGINKKEKVREIDVELDSLKAKTDLLVSQLETDAVSSKAFADISRIEQGITPDDFVARVSDVADEAVRLGEFTPFKSPAPKLDAKSPEASPLFSAEAQKTLDDMVEPTPENLDTLTDDILTALDEQEVDTKSVRADIEEINETAARDEAGLREALNCMLGK